MTSPEKGVPAYLARCKEHLECTKKWRFLGAEDGARRVFQLGDHSVDKKATGLFGCEFLHVSYLSLSLYLSIYLSSHPAIQPSSHPAIQPSSHPAIQLASSLSIYLSIYLSTYLSIYLSIYLSNLSFRSMVKHLCKSSPNSRFVALFDSSWNFRWSAICEWIRSEDTK